MDRSAMQRQESPGRSSTAGDCEPASLVPLPPAAPPQAEAAGAQSRIARLVQTLESDIIPRLVRAHRVNEDGSRSADGPAPAVWPDVVAFARQSYATDDAPMRVVVQGLLAAGCPVTRLYVDLLAPTARTLGELWEDDQCDFTDVTVGVGRLQQLLRELSPAFGAEIDHLQDGRRILLLPAPGEQHTLGASMVAEFFRRAGWDVVGGVSGSGLDPVQAVQSEWFDILGLSAGSHARVDWLRDCVAGARRASLNRGLGVLLGGPLFVVDPGAGALVGCDAVVTDGEQGPERAEALLASRTQRL
jgi:MerR family transcriptional regulator, light-induced transcriptional regulator